MISLAFEGPVRMIFSIARIETLLYLRDVLAMIVVIKTALQGKHGQTNTTGIFLYAMLCHSILGLWIGHPLASTLFGFKIFIGLMMGMACGKYLSSNQAFITKFITFLFIACSIGAYVNYFYGVLPWEGAEFESAFGAATNKMWWAGGERRLPGFARISTTTAAAIGITGVFLAGYTRNYLYKALILIAGLPAIFITTSKGVILSFLIVGIWCFIPAGAFRRKSGVALLWGNAILALMLPFVSYYVRPNPNIIRSTPGFLSSFADRASTTWPNALEDLNTWHLWLLGQGVGGIGSPLRFGAEYLRFNPIDNLFLYMFTVFGALGVIYYLFAAVRISKVADLPGDYHLGLLAMGIHFFCYGITAHQIEDAFEAMWMGMLITYIPLEIQNYRRQKSKNSSINHSSPQQPPSNVS